ncbi:putative SMN complex, gem-associated protein [Plasmopara halstedii]
MDKEKARARMLRMWLSLSTNDARTCIRTTQGTVVHAEKLIANAKQTLLACTNLATPLGTYAYAVLRDQDVAQLECALTTSKLQALVLDDIEFPEEK